VIARALRLVQPAADRQGVTIDVHVDAEVPRFLADEELLRQALVNLLMNAMQATAAGDRIRVRATADATFVHIAVEDSGHGVDSADLDSVFKRFFTTRHTGTGLGLPITREIVERHGGSLELRSDPGRGTAVTMRFPIRVSDDRTGDDS
jgi:signal transduction histidine kinase